MPIFRYRLEQQGPTPGIGGGSGVATGTSVGGDDPNDPPAFDLGPDTGDGTSTTGATTSTGTAPNITEQGSATSSSDPYSTLSNQAVNAATNAQQQTNTLTGYELGPGNAVVGSALNTLEGTNYGLTGLGSPPPPGSAQYGLESNAQTLLGAAAPYATGQLTPAQQLQVGNYTQQQTQGIGQQLASQGITDSSIAAGYDQQIANNAAMLSEALVEQNFGIAENAQSSAAGTYSSLINDAMSEFGPGMTAVGNAINQTLSSNSELANLLGDTTSNIAQGATQSAGTNPASAATTAANAANTAANAGTGVNASNNPDVSSDPTQVGPSGETGVPDTGIDTGAGTSSDAAGAFNNMTTQPNLTEGILNA
jgi:hypothetical protein